MTEPIALKQLAATIGSGGPRALRQLMGDHPLLVLGISPPCHEAAVEEPTRTVRLDVGDETHASNKLQPFALLGSESTVFAVATSPASPFPGVVTVGRAPTSDIVLESSSVSKLHALIRGSEATEWRLIDNGSLNGSTLNGQSLEAHREYPLLLSDALSFGGVRGIFLDAPGVCVLLGRVAPKK